MSGGLAVAASLAAALAGLVASAMLTVDYLRPVPLFCAEGSGCDALRRTAIAAPLGLPLPALGLAGFLAIGVVSLLAGRRARVAAAVLAGVAAFVGVMLLGAQAAFDQLCPYCSVADASGIASAGVAWWRLTHSVTFEPSRTSSFVGAALLVAAALVPIGIGLRASASVPFAIRAEIAATPTGEVTVVDFVDFECPFCRQTNSELEPLLAAHEGRVRVVRRQVPLRSHAHALDAARAACCGDRLGKGNTMASALFAAPVDELTREGCEKVAQRVGLALAPYRACVADPQTDESIEADRAEFKAAGGFALPTIWIGERQLIGAQTREALAKALDEALARAGG
jgi:uncharacterized membrane protein/protein-disulfide isomerase